VTGSSLPGRTQVVGDVLEFLDAGRNVLLVGPHGSGKTAIINVVRRESVLVVDPFAAMTTPRAAALRRALDHGAVALASVAAARWRERGTVLPPRLALVIAWQDGIELDGTPEETRLGANALLGVSMAVARAVADSADVPLYRYLAGERRLSRLPVPMINVVNGGAHAPNTLDFQEFMLVPAGAPTFREAIRWSAEVFHALKALLKKAGHPTSVGDEGGYAPNFRTAEEALDSMVRAIEHAGYRPGADVGLALDPAASEMWEEGGYAFHKAGGRRLTPAEMVDLYADLVRRYPIISIEDGLAENDWDGWKALTDRLGASTMLVGDDIFVTNPKIITKGIAAGVANATLIKLNQIGTVTETLQAIETSRKAGYKIVISRIRSSRTSPWPWAPSTSRAAPSPARSASRSTTS
jgi:L-alanine-DL-glutamate epimerase-like enolase superfamily enzyme